MTEYICNLPSKVILMEFTPKRQGHMLWTRELLINTLLQVIMNMHYLLIK